MKTGGLEVRPLVSVDLHGGTKGEEPEFLVGDEGGLGLHVGEGDRQDKLGEEVKHHKDDAVATGCGWEGVLTADKVEGDNVVLFTSAERVEGVMRATGSGLEGQAGRAGGHEDSGVNLHGGPIEEVLEALFQALIA